MWPFPDSGQNVNVKVESSHICILLVSSSLSCRVITVEFALQTLTRGSTLVRYKAGAIYFAMRLTVRTPNVCMNFKRAQSGLCVLFFLFFFSLPVY